MNSENQSKNGFRFAFFCLILITASAEAANLHDILVINTLEPNRSDRIMTYNLLSEKMMQIAGFSGLDHSPHHLIGTDFNFQTVFTFLSVFQCGTDDTVIFIYDSHGYNLPSVSKWPSFYFPENEFPMLLEDVFFTLKKKQPRLLIVLSGSCNFGDAKNIFVPSIGSPSNAGIFPLMSECYQDLFARMKGTVRGTASSIGQYSWNSHINIYLEAFSHSIENECANSLSPSWHSIMNNAYFLTTQKLSIVGLTQNPKHVVEVVKNSELSEFNE